MSKSKAKGTAAETAVVKALQRLGWPHVERRALQGTLDKGDIAGIPGVCFEVKDAKTWQVSGWLQETMEERVNANATHGILVIKLPGIGHANADKWLTVMDDDHARKLWVEAMPNLPQSTLAPLYVRTIKALGVDAGIVELKDVERELEEAGKPPLGMVRVKRRLSALNADPSYYNLMRLDARCRLLTYAGYGGHAIMGEAM
jgi:hypothetical protein